MVKPWLAVGAVLSVVGLATISLPLDRVRAVSRQPSRDQKHLELEEKLDYLVGILGEHKHTISEKIREYGEGTQSAYSRGVMANLRSLGLSFTTYRRGRNLQSADAYLSGVANIGNRAFGDGSPRIGTMAGAMSQFQALTCNGANPKPGVTGAATSALESAASGLSSSLGVTITGIPTLVTSVLRCACSPEWDFSDPAWQRLFDSIRATIRGDTSTLESSLRACVPLLMGDSGMCGTTCQTTWSDVYTWMLEVVEAVTAVS